MLDPAIARGGHALVRLLENRQPRPAPPTLPVEYSVHVHGLVCGPVIDDDDLFWRAELLGDAIQRLIDVSVSVVDGNDCGNGVALHECPTRTDTTFSRSLPPKGLRSTACAAALSASFLSPRTP